MEQSKAALEDIFQLTQQVNRSEISLKKGTDDLVKAYGFKPSSANSTIRSVRHMLNGERYRRRVTTQITEYVMGRISEEYGPSGLRKALTGLSAHIDYLHSLNVNAPGLQTVLAKFSK